MGICLNTNYTVSLNFRSCRLPEVLALAKSLGNGGRVKKIMFVQGFCRAAADALVDNDETENEDERRHTRKFKRSKQEGAPFSA